MKKYTKTSFTLSGEKDWTFKGITFGGNWNGFEQPLFNKESAEKFVSMFNADEDLGVNASERIYKSETEDHYILESADGKTTIPSQVIDGETYYSFEDLGLCWEKGLKQWTLTLLTKGGELIDTTSIHAIDRDGAMYQAKMLIKYQGLSSFKFKLNLVK
jgi:hypothetical protein